MKGINKKMDSNKQMADLLFKNITKTPDDYEQMYPKRNLEEGAVVTRFAPSPTGFLHFGGLFAAFIGKTATKSTNGVFYLRIEDTDKKREVENGVSLIVKGLNDFGIEIDEGMLSETDEKGAYGPYTQSKRKDIYQAYVKSLVEQGLAYPCFMTEEELATIREKQESEKLLPGVYGEFAKYRDITVEEAQKKWKEDADEAARLAKLNKDERAKEEMRIEREKFEKEKSEFAQKQLVAETANQLLERGLSKNFAECLCGKTAEETKANIDAFEKDFNAAVEKAVTERMKGNPPKFNEPDNKGNDPFLAGFIN